MVLIFTLDKGHSSVLPCCEVVAVEWSMAFSLCGLLKNERYILDIS